MSGAPSPPPILRMGVIGLGGAAMQMLPSLLRHPGVRLTAVADIAAAPRERFAADTGAVAHVSAESLCADPQVDAVYIATPHALHVQQAILAAQHGKHVLVEKPMALTIEGCIAIRDAAIDAGVHVVVGHTHAFDPPVRALADLVHSGRYGDLAMINACSYGSFLYRPRRPEELDTARGGGVLFNQLPHQVDMVREIGGGLVRSVRSAVWSLDPKRPTEGSALAFLDFESGAAASLTYSGHDFFDTDELHGWIGENGEPKRPDQQGSARRALRALPDEAAAKATRGYGGLPVPQTAEFLARCGHPHAGILVASCARADLRLGPYGVVVYDEDGRHDVPVPRGPAYPDKSAVVQELYDAALHGVCPRHDASWGVATMEVCLAVATSAGERREITLRQQVPVSAGASPVLSSPPGGGVEPQRGLFS